MFYCRSFSFTVRSFPLETSSCCRRVDSSISSPVLALHLYCREIFGLALREPVDSYRGLVLYYFFIL